MGAVPLEPPIPGIDLPHVTNSHDVLAGKIPQGNNVVIIGGGLVGLEVAEYLADMGKTVTVVEMLDEVGKDLGQLRKICVMESIYALGINTMVKTKCLEIREGSVLVEKEGQVQELAADSVVIATGARSRAFEKLASYCEEKGIPYYVVGDALSPRRALNAIAEAAEVARQI